MELVKYETARTALAECHRVDEVKDIRDKAEAMAAYARQAKDQDLIQYATEIKVRAERRCGELTRVMDTAQGARRDLTTSSHAATKSKDEQLSDVGLTRQEAHRYEALAAMPAEHFETAVATAKATAGEVTTAFMLRAAKGATSQKRSRADRVVEIRALVESGHNVEQIADLQGVNVEYVRLLLNEEGIKVAMPKRGRQFDSNKIVRESVAALSGIAHGLSLAKALSIDAAEAKDLLADLRSSMKALRNLDHQLKEIANGQ